MRPFASIVSCVLLASWPLLSQSSRETVLDIEVQNVVSYRLDTPDVSKLASSPSPTAAAASENFSSFLMIGDIVAVNGKPAKGLFLRQGQATVLRTAANAGQGVADMMRQNTAQTIFDILHADGTPIGSVLTWGLVGGAAPPGAPSTITGANSTVVGGTGAFLGARGQAGGTITNPRQASASEDPSNRRIHGGGTARQLIQIIPVSGPEVVVENRGPLVVHSSDFSVVTNGNPAAAGELISLFATGLGPTRPSLEPGRRFTASPLQIVTSPVEVTLGGLQAEVLYAGGFAETTNTYQVNFRVPSGLAPGQVNLQVSAAWISSPEVRISVR